MTTRVKAIIGVLSAAVIVLTVALGFVLMDGHDDEHMGRSNDGYHGMMQAMGNMNTDQMLSMMRSILGEEGFKAMQQHMAEHRNGMQSMYDGTPGGMMHQMMDGMMQRMPDDQHGTMPRMMH
jgi:hypothetical protein